MEGASIGFLIGAIVCLMAFMTGRISADVPEEKNKNSTESGKVSQTEMMAVLGYFQLGATGYERKVLGAIMDIIEKEGEKT